MTDQEFKDCFDRIGGAIRKGVHIFNIAFGVFIVATAFIWGWSDYFHRLYH
jgi:hypothetical protein